MIAPSVGVPIALACVQVAVLVRSPLTAAGASAFLPRRGAIRGLGPARERPGRVGGVGRRTGHDADKAPLAADRRRSELPAQNASRHRRVLRSHGDSSSNQHCFAYQVVS